MGRKCCIKVKKCKKSCSSSSSSSSCSSSSSSSCCPLPCRGQLVVNASGGVTGTVASSVFTLATLSNMTNVTINTVSTYVGPTNVQSGYYKRSSKCCPVYLTASGTLANGAVQVVTATNNYYGGSTTYSNPVTIASSTNTTAGSTSFTTTLAPNQAIAFVPGTATGNSSMTFQYAPLTPYQTGKCC